MTPSEIVAACAHVFRTDAQTLRSAASARTIGQGRAAAVFVLREYRQSSKLTFDQIARLLNRETQSIWYWWIKARDLRARSPRFRLATDALLVSACYAAPFDENAA